MEINQITAFLLILGTVLIYIGFGAFPPRIYTEKDVQVKLNLLNAQPQRWVVSQSLVIIGSMLTLGGLIFLIPLFNDNQAILLIWIGVTAFVVGHIFWIWHLLIRTGQPERFAKNELPGWLFWPYSILVLVSLANFGIAFWVQEIHRVIGIGIFFMALFVLVLFLRYKDMPPFIYYAMTAAIGVTILF
jgi:hypothetical protein